MHFRIIALIGLLFGTIGSSAKAQLENYNFVIRENHGSTLGLVTGEILGLETDGTSMPSEIIVSNSSVRQGGGGAGIVKAAISAAVTPSTFPLIFTPDDFDPTSSSLTDEFTVSDGSITFSNFSARDSAGDTIIFDTNSEYGFSLADSSDHVISPIAYFTLVVPEPASLPLALLGLSLLMFFGFRRNFCRCG